MSADGYAGDGGPATGANLEAPSSVVHDAAGNMYIADRGNSCIRMVAYGSGTITTIAGTGAAGFSGDGSSATSAQLNYPAAVALDTSGNLYIADTLNNRIRVVNLATTTITTLAGTGTAGYSGDGGSPAAAELNGPIGMVFDSAGNLYIADYNNSSVRKVSADQSVITTAVGNGVAGFSGDGGLAANAQLSQANFLAIDTAGNLYIADYANARVRLVDHTSGKITTVAGNGSTAFAGDGGPATAAALQPAGIAVDNAGNLFIVDTDDQRIRVVSAATGLIETIAGTGAQDYTGDGGPAIQAAFDDPGGIEVNNGIAYIADSGNNMIRTLAKIPPVLSAAQVGANATTNIYFQVTDSPISITSLAFSPSPAGATEFTATVQGCATDGTTQNDVGTLCVVQVNFTPAYPGLRSWPLVAVTSGGTQNFAVTGAGQGSEVTLSPGTITSIAGTGAAGYSGDSAAAASATLKAPQKSVVDSIGNVYIADTGNNVIRKIAAGTGTITTLAGNGTACSSSTSACGDGSAATSADLNGPAGVAVDGAGNLYIADTLDNRIREVNAATGVITTIAGTGAPAYTGDGAVATAATLNSPSDVALDTAGNIYVADTANSVIREINPASGLITTVAGSTTSCPSAASPCGDGGPATAANLNQPAGLFVDPSGNIYIADTLDNRVREAAANGYMFTEAGSGNAGYSGDGSSGIFADLSAPSDVTLDSAGNIYIADSGNNVVRLVELASGNIVTIAGTKATACTPSTSPCGDAGPSTAANLNTPSGIALDGAGDLYVADTSDNRLREVSAASVILNFATTALGATSSDSPQTVTLFSTGTSALNLPQPPTGTNPVFSAGFALDGSGTCQPVDANSGAGQLVSGDACTYAVNFAPTQAGAAAGTLALTDDSLNAAAPGYTTQTVTLNGTGTTTTTLTTSNDAPSYGQSVTFTVTIAAATSAVPTGTVGFYNGSTLLSTVAVDASGSATLVTTGLPAGTDPVNAVYSGDSNNSKATSNTVTETVSQAGGVVSLTTSNASPTFGQSITLTDTIPVVNGAAPTGTVTFYYGFTQLGKGTVDGTGVATLATAALPGGTYTVIALYGGDKNYSLVISNGVTETVAKTAGADTLTTSNAAPSFGQSITLTDTIPTVNSTAPTGTVTFSNGTTVIGTGTVDASGVAALTTATLPAGTDSVTAVYGGDGNYATVTAGPLVETVAKSAGTDTLTTSNASPTYGQSITLTDTLPTVGGVVPTGTVTFSNGATALGTGPVSISGVATLTTAALPVGTDSVTALYSGDPDYASATAGPLTETVAKAAATDTLTTSDASPATGQSITLTDTIPVLNSTAPTGTVTFYNGAAVIGTGSVSALGAATLTTASLPSGSDSVTAVYPGDSNYAGGTAGPIVENVSKSTNTNVLTTSNASPNLGQAVTFTVTVPVVGGTAPTGIVTFYEATTVIGTGTLNGSGLATVTTSSLPAGSDSITAVYPGDSNYQSSNAGPLTETVAKSAAADTLTASNPAPTVGASVIFTDTIPVVAGSTPTGSVTFYSGTTAIGIGMVDASGVATVSTSSLTAGVNSITAVYAGDSNYASVTAGPIAVTVGKAGGSGVLTSSNQTPSISQSVTFTDTLPVLNGTVPTGSVTFYNGAASIGAGNVNASGIATFTTGSLPVGTDSITAVYPGDTNYSAATAGPLVETVGKAAGTDTLFSSNQSSVLGQFVTLIDALSVVNGITPTGTVTFYNGTTAIGTGTVNASSFATLTTGSLPAGSDSITAVYGGDGYYGTATAGPLVETVSKVAGNDVLTSSDMAPVFGVSVTLTDTIALVKGLAPTGSVTFFDGSTTLGTGAVSASGVAVLTTGSLPVGIDLITAVYAGDGNYLSSTAGSITEVVTMPAVQTAAATLKASTNAITLGQSVTFTGAITLVGGVAPTGTVTFSSGTTALGAGAINATGVATYTTTALPIGSDSITMAYAGDAKYGSASAGPVMVTVSAAAATDFTISATSADTSVAPGAAATYTITLAGLNAAFNLPVTLSATGMPSGAVVSFKQTSVVPGAGPTTTTMTIQTPTTQASLSPSGSLPIPISKIAYGLLLLPLLGVRKFRRKLRALPQAVTYLFALLAVLAAFGSMTGCAGGSLGQPAQQYTITVTGSSNTLQHSTKVILTVQ